MFRRLHFLPLIFIWLSCGLEQNQTTFENAGLITEVSHHALTDIVESRKILKNELCILIEKTARTLLVYHKQDLLITYP